MRAVRVIVENEIDCYPVLGIVHKLWRLSRASLMIISPRQRIILSQPAYGSTR
ncbi:hypothetical protein HC776_03765 [bacterium]|nr:hypothetical protein [bacterium]